MYFSLDSLYDMSEALDTIASSAEEADEIADLAEFLFLMGQLDFALCESEEPACEEDDPCIHCHKVSEKAPMLPGITRVVFNDPATVVFWEDGTKTVVKCQKGDRYSKETGLAMAALKRICGNTGSYNDLFAKWIPKEEKKGGKKTA